MLTNTYVEVLLWTILSNLKDETEKPEYFSKTATEYMGTSFDASYNWHNYTMIMFSIFVQCSASDALSKELLLWDIEYDIILFSI